jgi:hypothetical protein
LGFEGLLLAFLKLFLPEEGIERRLDAPPEAGHVGIEDQQKDKGRKDDQDRRRRPLHDQVLVGAAARRAAWGSGRLNAGASLVYFRFFLEDRDLGFFFLLPEVVPKEEHRAQRQHRQQEFEEAFHQNLPYLILFKRRKKSIAETIT